MVDRAKKISELTTATSVADDDLLVIVANTTGSAITKSTSVSTMRKQLIGKDQTPANSSATGVAGQLAIDSSYIYYCVANNTWKRAALSTW